MPDLFTAFGLSASAGLNAYIPLLVVALTARYTDLLTLNEPFDILTNGWVIAVLVVLLVIEVLADKVPAIDHLNDVLGTIVRPIAGAILFAAAAGNVFGFLDPRLAAIAGFLTAGVTHGAKATARPIVTATTGGVGNPVVSTMEDVASLLTSIVAILAPLLIALAFVLFVILFFWWRSRRRRSGTQAPTTP
jgi:hypothetical protein